MKQIHHQPNSGFTLIEVIAVVSIISLIVLITVPALRAMRRESAVSNGVNSISVMVTTAKVYAARKKVQGGNLLTPTGVNDGPPLYSGVAAIFTPAGEIRLAENFTSAWDQAHPGSLPSAIWPLERLGPTREDIQTSIVPERELNGFKDLNVDYMLLPIDTGLAGILRNNNAVEPTVIAPPFALWLDQNGHLVVGNRTYEYVYYDGDYQNGWNTNPADRRQPDYNPKAYDPEAGSSFDPSNWDDDKKRYKLPFDMIETVIGVFSYSKSAFDSSASDAGSNLDWTISGTSANQQRWEWLKKNGQMLLFSRQSGSLVRGDNS